MEDRRTGAGVAGGRLPRSERSGAERHGGSRTGCPPDSTWVR